MTEENQLIAISFSEFLEKEIPPRENILSPWLPRQGLAMIHAERGIGKTHVALGIAYAVATGGNFLKWSAPMPRGVLFLDGEMPADALQERFQQCVAHNGGQQPSAPLSIITPDYQESGMPNLATEEGQIMVEVHITDEVDLIIIDNISTLVRTGDENEAKSWIPVQEWLLSLRARGKAVLLIHHSGKSGNQRGTSKREDVLDTVICLERPSKTKKTNGACFTVKYQKNRGFFGEDAEPFEAHFQDGLWTINKCTSISSDEIKTLLAEGLSQSDIARKLGKNKSTISRYLKGR